MPARALPTPRTGFAFATTTPVEPSQADAPAKPTEAQIGSTSFERDEDLAIPRSSTADSEAEPAVIGAPIDASRDSLDTLQPPSLEDAPTVARAPIQDSGPNPFDEQVWRAEGGNDSSAELDSADVNPIVGNPMREAIGAFVKNKRNIAIAVGGLVVLIALIVMASGGGDKPSTKQASNKRPTKTQRAATSAGETAATQPPTGEAADGEQAAGAEVPTETPNEPPADETPPTETPPVQTDPATDTKTATASEPKTEPKKKSGSTIRGKQVVLEYDTQARDAKPVPNASKDDQAAISKARTSYAAGNTRLFAGDADGAIKNYRQALAYYPAYVGAYRGLGLAYAQKGDKPNALKALRTYLGTVPGAKDAPLIRKRIDTLK